MCLTPIIPITHNPMSTGLFSYFLEYPLTPSAECICLIIRVPLVVIQDRMFGHNRGIIIGNMGALV